MRSLTVPALLVALALHGQVQDTPRPQSTLEWAGRSYALGREKLVAGDVDEAIWSPDGEDVAYISRGDSSTQVGVYSLKHRKAAILATFGPTEKLEQTLWLNEGHMLVLASRRPVEGRPAPTELLSIQVGDTETLRSQELWSQEIPNAEATAIEINPSPTLSHALVTITGTKSRVYLVLTENAKSIVISTDIEDAAKAGHALAGWSVYGTALFEGPSDSQTIGNQGSADGGNRERRSFASIQQSIGEYALECVPTNGVLRQVRTPGFFQPADPKLPWLRTLLEPCSATEGQTTSTFRSLWLVLKSQPGKPTQGLLVSAEADGGWISPTGKQVAFTCHHALFVRPIDVSR